MPTTPPVSIHLGEIWHLTADPFECPESAFRCETKGALAVDAKGVVLACGPAAQVVAGHPTATVCDHGDSLILPGFVDGHLHYPQLDIIGSHGEQLLGWLNRYTFPAEARFADADIARDTADRLITELLAHGVTTAMMFSSVHAEATATLFQCAADRGLRAIIGKVSMDRHAPASVLQDAASDLIDTEQLIQRWHGAAGGRLHYALTPRFVPTCGEALLAGLGELRARHPQMHVQTHWAENMAEIDWVRKLCPTDGDYLGVYERHGLLGPKTVLAHAIHVDAAMLARVAAAGASLAHCPTSNLFLGSGLFPLHPARQAGVSITLGSDIGAGTSLAPWRTMLAAYEIQQLRGEPITPAQLLHLATLGGAAALGLEASCGNFAPGKQADFQVLDWRRNRLLASRFEHTELQPAERLFALITLGDDRLTREVYVAGRKVYAAQDL